MRHPNFIIDGAGKRRFVNRFGAERCNNHNNISLFFNSYSFFYCFVLFCLGGCDGKTIAHHSGHWTHSKPSDWFGPTIFKYIKTNQLL